MSIRVRDNKRIDTPDGIWFKCSKCGEIIYNGELSRNLRICHKCNHYFPLEPAERIAILADKGIINRYTEGSRYSYPDKESCDRTIITGEVKISGHRLVIASIDFSFLEAAINPTLITLYLFEKLTMAISRAETAGFPLLICINSMGHQPQDTVFFPAQTLGISAAIGRFARKKLLYISMLAQSDSYAYFPGFVYLADIILAESNVTPSTIQSGSQVNRDSSSIGSQTLLQNGIVDKIISRIESKQFISDILDLFC